MRIDCHCHIFNHDCVPVSGVLASRFGPEIGQKALEFIQGIPREGLTPRWRDGFKALFQSLFRSMPAQAVWPDGAGVLSRLHHAGDFIAFLEIGTRKIPEIWERLNETSREIDIWVPLMMDMSYAYPGCQPLLSLGDQRKAMMRLTLEAGGRVMPFYAFDPRGGLEAVMRTKRAIETQGFVGVKLYPPLGFRPIGNEDKELDKALLELYGYCCKEEGNPVPIIAHCSWSGGVYSNQRVADIRDLGAYYRSMAHPKHWAKVLEIFPVLKVNLAHFGGLGEWTARANGNPPRENWADPIVALMRDYENVYTDLSFHSLPTSSLAEAYREVLLEKIRGLEHKVLLGSDWYMSRMHGPLQDYWQGFEGLFSELFDKMTGENAVAFLRSEATERFFPRFFASGGRLRPPPL